MSEERPGWYPLALSVDLEPGTSTGTRLFGHELVVWRDAEGRAHAWEDRCPHRGMRLSFGFVRGDHIACLYHGWRYDSAGQCRYIPAHPDLEVSPMIRTRLYASVERAGLICVAWGDEAGPSPDDLDDLSDMAPLRSLYLDRPAADLRAALAVGPAGEGLVRTRLGGIPVLVGIQPLSREQSAAHVLIDTSGGPPSLADRIRTVHACNALRRTVELRASS